MSARIPPNGNLRQRVENLLSQTCMLPCSTVIQAFLQLVEPRQRFQVALDVLLPLLDPLPGPRFDKDLLAQRILVAFLLYSLYAPYPITINPFKSVLFVTFRKERANASVGVTEDEQLVWVLWKLLRGDGNDIGPYSPNTLARTPLPQELKVAQLELDDALYDAETNLDYAPPTKPAQTISAENDKANDNIARAMPLLLEARERVLTLSERRILLPAIPSLASTNMITPLDLFPIVSYNSTLAHPLFVALLTTPGASPSASLPSPFLDVLCSLPPTLPTFDLVGRLLQDSTLCADGITSIGSLVRVEVLGRFVFECIRWLENADWEEREGMVSDDRFAMGVKNLCRFYASLVKLSIVDPTAEEDTIEMASFSLQNSKFEEANTLYKMLVAGRA
ncbi:hypothetical protein CYLTODRAFT_429529 [Cylindrobasidium torrendii FP15055 ss-10]|uniref:Uncharacterized protein n=1 Tax=Cylindrobasidium torrendii FP15055 ss-10 TaxID=1314674 RepID=A0A0D7BLN6_9AGAR|nr:hypothetical protein CYLTODRAFT_429529 [Cylindrobasidium torrendii FP15055 ss-10]